MNRQTNVQMIILVTQIFIYSVMCCSMHGLIGFCSHLLFHVLVAYVLVLWGGGVYKLCISLFTHEFGCVLSYRLFLLIESLSS